MNRPGRMAPNTHSWMAAGLAIAVLVPSLHAAPSRTRIEAAEIRADSLYRRTLPSIMTLVTDRRDGTTSIGTGFLAIRDGLAITALHVVEGANRVTARFANGEEFDVSGLVDSDERRDVALIRVKVFGRPMLEVDSNEPPVGTRSYVVGAPRGMEFSLSEGIISQVQVIESHRMLQFTCPASPGNSGGPLLNARGSVVGVVSVQFKDGQNLNFAVPISTAMALDNTLPTKPWTGGGSVSVASSAIMPSGAVDGILARALVARMDINNAILSTWNVVIKRFNGYQRGVPAYLYRFEQDARLYADTLGRTRSDDQTRTAAIEFLKRQLEEESNSALLLAQAIQTAQNNSGWGPAANDMISRGAAIRMGEARIDTSVWMPLVRTPTFRTHVPEVGLAQYGLANDSTGYVLGVRTWSRNSLLVSDVAKGTLAEALHLKAGDLVVAVNDQPVSGFFDLKRQIAALRERKCALTVIRDDKRVKLYSARVPATLLSP